MVDTDGQAAPSAPEEFTVWWVATKGQRENRRLTILWAEVTMISVFCEIREGSMKISPWRVS